MYSSPKIIISKIGKTCESFLDKNGDYASIDTNCIHNFKEKYHPEYVLCFLNSKLYNYVFECLFDGLRMSKGYLPYSAPNLKHTYIKEIPKNNQELFIDFANKMFSLNTELDQKRFTFIHRVVEAFNSIKINDPLKKFDHTNFKIFISVLKKQKIRLSLKDQDEWEEYFNSHKKDCNDIAAQIAELEHKIDNEVYALYGLTPEEIATIECN